MIEQFNIAQTIPDVAEVRSAWHGIEVASDAERQASVVEAIDTPAVTCELAGPYVKEALYAKVPVPASIVDLDKLSGYSREQIEKNQTVFISQNERPEDIVLPDAIPSVHETEAEIAKDAVQNAIVRSVPELRLATDDVFKEAMGKGCALRQFLRFDFNNGVDVSMANFGEIDITTEQQEKLKQLLDKVNELTKGGISDTPSSIFVLPHSVLQEIRGTNELGDGFDINGYANNGRIVLSDKLFREGQKADKEYTGDVDEFVSTLAHEFGHLVEKFAEPEIRFADRLDWQSRTYELEDGTRHTVHGIGTKHLDQEEVKPTSWYGYTKPGEDFAEAFSAIVLDSPVDDVRRMAVMDNISKSAKTNTSLSPKIESSQVIDASYGKKFGLVPDDFQEHFKIRFGYLVEPETKTTN